MKKKGYYPFVVLFLLELFLHSFMVMTYGDDMVFSQIYKNEGVWNRLIWNYYNWSTRLVIEGVYYNLYRFPFWLWKILDSLIMVLSAYSISKLVVTKNEFKNNVCICAFVLCFPLMSMVTAGWISTSANYTWPIALGLYAYSVLKQIYEKENVKNYHYILATLATIYASNAEQVACALWGIWVIAFLYHIWKKDVKAFHILLLMLNSAMLMFKVTGPSNEIVNKAIAGAYEHAWYTLDLVDKIYLGVSTTFYYFFLEGNVTTFILVFTIAYGVFSVRKEWKYRILGVMPLVFIGITSIFPSLLFRVMPFLQNVYSEIILSHSISTYTRIGTIVALGTYLVLCVNICINIYIIFANSYKTISGIAIFGAGIAVRVLMGFAASLFPSVTRTNTTSHFLFILLSAMIVHDAIDLENKKGTVVYCFVIIYLSVLSYLNVLAAL